MTKDEFDKLSKEERSAWCAGNFPDFCRYALGYGDMNGIHDEICLTLQFDEHKSKMFLMPRNTFKSSVITCGYALFQLLHDPNLRVLIYSDSSSKAEGFLTDIKNHIEGKARNSLFRTLYGSWETTPHTGKWNDSQIVIRPRTESRKEPSIDTAGIETSKVGAHYDIIFFDDIVTDLNTTTKAQMDKTYQCYQKALSLLKPGGLIVIVGTRWAFGEAHGRIIDENKDNPTFKIVIKKAYELKEGVKAYNFADCGEESLTPEFLEDKRKKLGMQFFSCLYLNNPASDETAVFKADNFHFFHNVNTDNLYKVCTVDPAGEGEDFTAITVCGYDAIRRMYVLDLVNDHLKPSQIVDKIIYLSYKWKFTKLGVETNTFKGMLEDDIKKAVEKERLKDNFTDFSTELFVSSCRKGEGKHARILALEPIHERGMMYFRGNNLDNLPGIYSDLAEQMLQYTYDGGKSKHDDLVDALSFQVKLMRAGYKAEDTGPEKGSLAWMELDEFNKFQRLNRRLPRSIRKKMELVFQD